MPLVKTALFLGLASSALATTTSALADEKMVCLAAASKGQTLRDAHALLEARDQFRACARQECPAMVQQDCGAWLGEVERGVPTVVLTAKDGSGADLVDVKVSVDGQPLAASLDGQSVPVNPGAHRFRFDGPGGAHVERQVLIKEGEKNQGIAVVFAPTSAPPSPAPAEGARVAETPASTSSSSSRGAMHLWGAIVGGAGLVGVGVGVGLGLDAKSKDNAAAGEPGTARQTDSKAAAQQGTLATIVFGVGAAALAGGAVLWLLAPSAQTAIGTNGRDVVLRGSF
jgi:hypothetical protein